MEAEHSPYSSYPSPDKYDIKVSYSRDSNVTWAYFCDWIPRLTEMGQPDVPVGREKLVASFISKCNWKWRMDYLSKLMKYIYTHRPMGCMFKEHSRWLLENSWKECFRE